MAVTDNHIKRIIRYKNALHQLKKLGLKKIYSENLASAVGVTSSLIRKDFALFGIKGNRNTGYDLPQVIEQIERILGKSNEKKIILIGVGNLGTGLLRYAGFASNGMRIVAGFDIAPPNPKSMEAIPVYNMSLMESFIREHHIDLAIITTPESVAQEIADLLIHCGIKGILNFTPISLQVPNGVRVKNINFTVEMENLIYFSTIIKTSIPMFFIHHFHIITYSMLTYGGRFARIFTY